jgi:hypothetical protein
MALLEVTEGGLARVDREIDRAAAAAVTAVGAATRNMSLAPERRGTVAARTGRNPDPDTIEEHPSIVAAAAG